MTDVNIDISFFTSNKENLLTSVLSGRPEGVVIGLTKQKLVIPIDSLPELVGIAPLVPLADGSTRPALIPPHDPFHKISLEVVQAGSRP